MGRPIQVAKATNAQRIKVLGHEIPEGKYHSVVTEIPKEYGLGSNVDKALASGKGYEVFKELPGGKTILICDQAEKDARDRAADQKARRNVSGRNKSGGDGVDVKSITETTVSGGVDVGTFMANEGQSGMRPLDLITRAEQERQSQEAG